MKLPEFLADTNYRNPVDATHTPLQYAYKTHLSGYSWIAQPGREKMLENFNIWMAGQREGRADWLDFFPFREELYRGFDYRGDAVLMVDVGGGLGHELLGLRKRYPDLKGRLILQDLPETIRGVEDPDKVFEPMVHDFFTPQPIRGMTYLQRRLLAANYGPQVLGSITFVKLCSVGKTTNVEKYSSTPLRL